MDVKLTSVELMDCFTHIVRYSNTAGVCYSMYIVGTLEHCHTSLMLCLTCVCTVDPGILLHSFVGEVQRGGVSVKIELIPRVTGK